MPTYDIHAHIIVPEITRAAAPDDAWRPAVGWEEGRQYVDHNGKRGSAAKREFVRIDRILEEATQAETDVLVLCPWSPLMRPKAPADEALAACRTQNDALAALVRQYPERLRALGVVPLQDVTAAIGELERAVGNGLKGVEIGSNVDGVYPGDARYRPFWEACQALDVVVFIHPVESGGRAELRDYYMWNVVGNPVETTIAAAHLALSGTLEAYPDLKIVLAHGGGATPWLRGRWDRGRQVRREIRDGLPQQPSDYARHFYYDTITHDPQVLRWLVEFAGADHVLLGSDYPFDMGSERPAEVVRAAGLGADIEARILGDNAQRLLERRR